MEIFDIVDDNGLPTGQTIERKEAHAKGIRHRTAHIWVIRRSEAGTEVLLQKRSLNKDSFPGGLDTSSAGHIQAGDEPLASALRELSEELGIYARPEELKPIGMFRIQYEMEFYGEMFRDNEVSFVYAYEQPVNIDSLTLQKEEVDSVEWQEIHRVIKACAEDDPAYCVPPGGLQVVSRYLGIEI